MSGTPDTDDRLEIDPEDDERTDDPAGEPDEAEEADEPDEAEAGDEPEAAAGDAEPRGRRQFGELRESNRELARQNAEYTRRLAELEARVNTGGGQQYQQPQETPQQRANRLSLLSPEERIGEELRERDQFWANENQRTRAMVQDTSDRATFSSLTTTSKTARRFASEVDKRHNELKARGVFVERAVILKNILGEKVLEQETKPRTRTTETRRRQAAAPAKSGSDVRPSRRTSAGSAGDFEDRFGDIPI
ncbi:MAG TPA: hypothetical protein VN871_06165 [Mycobacterium sp.]|nr:hypothetical protein [Mycobacterium sp.]